MILASSEPPMIIFIGFGFLALLFVLIIIVHLRRTKKAKKALDKILSLYSFQEQQYLDVTMEQDLQTIMLHYYAIQSDISFENIYKRGSGTNAIYLFDINYTMRAHRETTWYTGRVFGFPYSTGFDHLFFIGKTMSKYGKTFEKMLTLGQHITTVSTGDSMFDDEYTLLVQKSNTNTEVFVPFALKLKPILDNHLQRIKKYPVGQSTYSCILSFTKEFCYIRFYPHNTNIEQFYHLAEELKD